MSTPHQLEEGQRVLGLMQALGRFPTLRAASAALGEPIANLCRYRKKYDGTLESCMPASDNAGRPKLALLLSDDERAFAKRHYLLLESLPLAIEQLADSPVCSHRTREFLNRYRETRDYPPSLYAALRVTDDEWETYRGGKKSEGKLFNVRRGMFLVDEQGHRREIVAGDIFEEDDVSVDCPYSVQLPDGSWRVGRQVLVTQDLRSGQYKGACAVARDRDSYRGEDIVRFNRWLIESHGLPGRFRFERGSWQSDCVEGLKLPDGRRWGGLKQLVPIDHCYTSNGKSIEQGFRMLHKVLGLHGVRIGKTRGEYLQPTADMMAVNEGRKHPDECGFIRWADLLKKFELAFALLNGRARYDRHSGEMLAPDDVWARDMQQRPGKRLPVCPADFAFHFLPVKRIVSVGKVRAGQVAVSLEDYRQPFLFRVAGLGADGAELPYLERGHKVIVCFDPHEAAAGAQIFNIDDSPRNGGFRLLQKILTAPLWEDSAQVDLSGRDRSEDPAVVAKKIRRQQVRAAFTSIGVFGQGARRVQHSHDGDGRTAQVAGAGGQGTVSLSPSAQAPAAPKPARTAQRPAVVEDFTEAIDVLPPGITQRSAINAQLSAIESDPIGDRQSAIGNSSTTAPALVFEDWA